ncbi:hypothetical protein C8R44DRAFT_866464 [Mycena epipterygia]|nr:hypothetical protein C8R44DRAFT_866464 [Mycena epipterygia]
MSSLDCSSSSPSSDPPADPQLEKEAQLKRQIAALQDQLAAKTPAPKAIGAKPYVTMGCALRKTVSFFDSLEELVAEYDRREELAEKREEVGDDTPVEHTAEQECLYQGFQELLRFVPGMKSAIMNSHPNELAVIYSQLRKGVAGAQGDNVNSVRKGMVDWVPAGKTEHLVASLRLNWGIEGEVTGPLLCPVDYDFNDPA